MADSEHSEHGDLDPLLAGDGDPEEHGSLQQRLRTLLRVRAHTSARAMVPTAELT
jgi:hypothetical protein